MKLLVNRWLRGLLLTGLYAIGVIGILASGDGDGDGVSGDFTCALIVRGIVPLSNGQVWVGVLAKTSDGNVDSVVLFNSDGSEQLRYEIGDGGTDNAILSIALSRDGNNYLYVGGSFTGGILRLKDDGTLDDGFDVGTGFDNTVTSIAPLADGYVYVGGLFTEFDNDPVSGLVRLDDTGSRDTDFIAIIPDGVTSVALADDGTDHVYSGAFIVPVLERWEADGGAEPVFSSSIGNNEVTSLAPVPLPLPLDDIYVGGIFTNGLIRLNRNGTADTVF